MLLYILMHYAWWRWVIHVNEHQGKLLATKSPKSPETAWALKKEIQLLQYLKKHTITFVPQIECVDGSSFTYPWISWVHFKDAYASATAQTKKCLILKLLDRAYALDCVWVIHGELIRPFTNVLVSSSSLDDQDLCHGEIFIIDFERGSLGDTSGKNMRSFSQRLLAEEYIGLEQVKSLWRLSRDEIYNSLKNMLTPWWKKSSKEYLRLSCCIFFLICFDILTKYFFYNQQLFSELIFLTPSFNEGIGWSIPVPLWIVLFLTVCVVIAMFWLWKKRELSFLLTCLIIAGALWNGWDRVVFGGVRDFIDVSQILFSWPIFNIADVYLTGAFVLLVKEMFWKR